VDNGAAAAARTAELSTQKELLCVAQTGRTKINTEF
jgi:hypothetical protein